MAHTKHWNNRPSAARISNRQMRRNALAAIEQNKHTYAILLTVLAQCGGEVVVGKDAITAVGRNLATLRYDVNEGVTGDYFTVRMTTGEGSDDSTEITDSDSRAEHEEPVVGVLDPAVSEAAGEADGSAGDLESHA